MLKLTITVKLIVPCIWNLKKTLRLGVRFLAPQPLSATNHFNFGFFAFLKKISGQNENDHAGLLDHRFEIL